MALLAAGESPGSLKLRRWDLPYTDTRFSGSVRPSRPHVHPRDRCRLLQRSRIARGASQPPTTQGAVAVNLTSVSPEQPGLEDTREVPLGTGSLANNVSDRFYGSLSNREVGEELQRLTIFVNSLLRDFTVVKDRVWHLEDDRHLVHERIERFQQVELAELRASSSEAGENLTVLSDRSAQLAGRMAVLEKKSCIDRESSTELEGRLELLDARLVACEEGFEGRMALLDERLVIREARDAEEDEKWLPPPPAPSPTKGPLQQGVSHDQLRELETKVEVLDARLTAQECNSGADQTFATIEAPAPAVAIGTIQFKGEDSVFNIQQIEKDASSFLHTANAKDLSVPDGRVAERLLSLRSGEVETVISEGVTGYDGEDENLAHAVERLEHHDGSHKDAAALRVAALAAAALGAEDDDADATPFDLRNVVGLWRGCRKPVLNRPSSACPEAAGAGKAGADAYAAVQDTLQPLAPASSSIPAATVGTEATIDAGLRASSTGAVNGRTDQQAPQWPLQDEFVPESSHVSCADQEERATPQLQQPQQPHEPAASMASATRGRQTSAEARVVPGQGLRSPSMSTVGVESGVVGSGAVVRNSSPKAPSADFSAVPE
mmetsp:Transcript_31736/g.62360  ORF Transcript_31736/g.62360 Transcript_31736/m.62360 type:complete len:607 (-) Transcript_31736:71-1891(-)